MKSIESETGRILLVDDDPALREATRRLLVRDGHEVIAAANVDEGMHMARAHRPALMLIDVNLPGPNGLDMVRLVKADPELSSIITVSISSGRTSPDDQAAGLDCGADGYIARPVANRELLARVRSHLRLKRTHDALRASELRLHTLIHESVDGLLIVDRDGGIRFANPAAEAMFGRGALAGAVFGHPLAPGVAAEIDLLTGTPQESVVEMRVAAIEWEGQPVLLCALRDVSERKRMERLLLDHKEALEQRVQERTVELESFCYTLSHDLRTPLRAINGFSQALDEECAELLDTNGRDYLSRIRAASEHMGELIDDMLMLSRLSKQDLHRRTVSLSEIAARIIEDIERESRREGVRWIVAPDLRAHADAALMRSLLENLLLNAYKYTGRKDRAVIELGSLPEAHAGMPVYFVRDDGAGFDMAFSDKLFRPFERLHSPERFPGHGIGLASAQRIVQRHGGRIWAEGAIGEGATFYFTLPE